MFDLPILQDEFGTSFGVYHPGAGFASVTIPNKTFHDSEHAKQFLRRLLVPEGFWYRFVHQLRGSPGRKTNADLLDQVAHFLLHDQLRIVELNRLNKKNTAFDGIPIASNNGKEMVFATARAMMFERSEKIKSFTDVASAMSFISSLNLKEEQLNELARDQDIQMAANSSSVKEGLAAALVNGNLVIVEKQKRIRSPHASVSESSSASLPGARAVPLGDHIDNGSLVFKTWFQLTLLDEVGEAINNVDLELAIDNRFEKLTTGADGKIQIENVNDRFAIASIQDNDQLYDVLESRWEEMREGDIPRDNVLATLPFPKASEPLSLSHETEHTVVFTPPQGLLFVELKDKTGRHLLTNRKYTISGPLSFEGTTNEQGIVRHEEVIPGDYILKLELDFFEGSDNATSDTYETPLVVLDAAESKPQRRLVGALPRIVKASIGGMLFDKNKSFLLPTALKYLENVRQIYAINNPAELLLVGHTDTTGEADINDPLSLERADNVKAYLEDDVDAWLSMYDKSLPANRVWGTREDKLMIRSMPDFRGSSSPIKWFQQTRQLQVDGKAGPKTRKKLIANYMALDGVKLANIPDLDINISTHGAGENFPAGRDGEALDKAAADNLDDLLDRRVEWFFFDKEFGIVPPAGSAKGEEYLQWRQNAEEHHDFFVESIFRKTTVLEVHDTLFRTNSCVVLPEGEAPEADNQHGSFTSIGLFATALRYNEEHPGSRVFVAGHTDSTASVDFNQKLSEERAKCAVAVLEGDRDTFVDLVNERFKVADYKQIYSWCTQAFEDVNFTCDPGAIDNNKFSGVQPTKLFQQNYNDNKVALGAEHHPDLKVDGAVGAKTWGAIFDVYEFALQQELGEDSAGLAELRDKVFWVDDDRKALGFSEHHPVDKVGLDNVRSQANRRVEVLFFAIGDEPDLVLAESDPDLSEIYLPVEYQHRAIEPMVSAKPWKAQWTDELAQMDKACLMKLNAPGLVPGVPLNFHISVVGHDTLEVIDTISSPDGVEVSFQDWDAPSESPFSGVLEAGEDFPTIFFTFTIEGGGRKVNSSNKVKYSDNIKMRLELEDEEFVESISEQPYLLCSVWGKRKGITGKNGEIDEKDIPPGGCCIAVRDNILIHSEILEHGWDEEII